MDSKFLIFIIGGSSKQKCEIRQMSKPLQKTMNISLPKTQHIMMYFEGNIMMVNERGKIV